MPDVVKRTHHGDGYMLASELRDLLVSVPPEAVITIHQDDPDDYRNAGHIGWSFEARWEQ